MIIGLLAGLPRVNGLPLKLPQVGVKRDTARTVFFSVRHMQIKTLNIGSPCCFHRRKTFRKTVDLCLLAQLNITNVAIDRNRLATRSVLGTEPLWRVKLKAT